MPNNVNKKMKTIKICPAYNNMMNKINKNINDNLCQNKCRGI